MQNQIKWLTNLYSSTMANRIKWRPSGSRGAYISSFDSETIEIINPLEQLSISGAIATVNTLDWRIISYDLNGSIRQDIKSRDFSIIDFANLLLTPEMIFKSIYDRAAEKSSKEGEENYTGIFISYSGEVGRQIAKLLKQMVKTNIQTADIMMAGDLESNWSILNERIYDSANLAILVITPESINSPWLNFEAGALSRTVGSGRMFCYVFSESFKFVRGPLAAYQGTLADKEGTLAMLSAANSIIASPVPKNILTLNFERSWSFFQNELEQIRYDSDKKKVEEADLMRQRFLDIFDEMQKRIEEE